MNAPTLIVGIGGMGGDIVCKLAERIEREKVDNVELVAMDTDVNELRQIQERFPRVYTVQTSPKGTVGRALDLNEHARLEWFPINDGLTGKPFTEGAGQVRAVSRLAFDYAVDQGLMEGLEKAIAKLRGLTGESMRQEMRIIITGSIAGGTGSGLVLPVAMYIRNFLITRYQDNSAIIRGFFLEPDVVFGRVIDGDERNSQRANAYAAVRELDAFFRKEYSGDSDEYAHIVFNAPQPGMNCRIDYPNILPYHFVFLMDALNADGDSLTDLDGRYDLEGYKKHAADCIFAQALSAVSARSNSSEDNVIRKLAANNGRSRYCGAGSSCLEYPKDDVQSYLAYTWAEDSLSGEWLEIDREYERELKNDNSLDRGSFYKTMYKSRSEGNSPFYKAVNAKAVKKDKDGRPINEEGKWVNALLNHAKNWSESDLLRESPALHRCLWDDSENDSAFPSLSTDPDAIMEKCNEAPDPESYMQSTLTEYFDQAEQYSRVAQEEVPHIAQSAARAAFSISESDDDPLVNRSRDWQLESILLVDESGQKGTIHPAAMRYRLYNLQDRLARQLTEADSKIREAKDGIDSAATFDYYDETDEEENVGEAVSAIMGGKKRLVKIPIIHKGDVTPDACEHLAKIATRLTEFKESVDQYVEYTSKREFVAQALVYVQSLSAAYESFYDHMKKQTDRLRSKRSGIEHNSEYNEQKGRAHRFVCASTECLRQIARECPKKGTSGDLPVELSGDIYRNLLLYVKRRSDEGHDYAARNEVSQEMFTRMFDEVVLDYWTNRVMDAQGGYPLVIDKSIISAIADEARYTTDKTFYDEAEQNRFALDYIKKTLEEARKLSTPFIEPPQGEQPRHINTCAFTEKGLEGAEAYYVEVLKLLQNSYGGQMADPKEFSKYEIMFYSSLYGFCADNLPKYAPGYNGLELRPEGEYHEAYYRLVNMLSPNLRDNKLITPHIDKSWHLVRALPDLNEGYEHELQRRIVHAFLYGLVFRQFGSTEVKDAKDRYHLKAAANRPQMDLWVSNGTPCDCFYEVFDALESSPPVVALLLESSEARMEREKNDTLDHTLRNCQLINTIRSQAFDIPAFKAWAVEYAEAIREAIGATAELGMTLELPLTLEPNAIATEAVTDLFAIGREDAGERRTSIFEIPLLYRLSLPYTELRPKKVDMMVEIIFDTIQRHLTNFCDESDLYSNCCQLFEEQYLLFEDNLMRYEQVFEGVSNNPVVTNVREKVLSYMEDSVERHQRLERVQAQIENAWKLRRRALMA